MQVRPRCCAFHDAQLHGFMLYGLLHFFRIAAFQPYPYLRIMAVEQGQQRRQHVLGHGGAGPQAQLSGNGGVPAGRHVFLQRFIFFQNAAGMSQQACAFRRQGDAAALPLEQAHVQQTFQFLDMAGDSRLGNEQLLRRAGEVKPPRNGLEHFQPEICNHGIMAFNHFTRSPARFFPGFYWLPPVSGAVPFRNSLYLSASSGEM